MYSHSYFFSNGFCFRYEIQTNNEEKIDIGKSFKLLIQILEKEIPPGILSSADFVCSILPIRMFFSRCISRNGVIRNNISLPSISNRIKKFVKSHKIEK